MNKTIATSYAAIGLAVAASYLYSKKIERDAKQATERLRKASAESARSVADLYK